MRITVRWQYSNIQNLTHLCAQRQQHPMQWYTVNADACVCTYIAPMRMITPSGVMYPTLLHVDVMRSTSTIIIMECMCYLVMHPHTIHSTWMHPRIDRPRVDHLRRGMHLMRDVMSSAIPQEVDTTLHVVTLPPLGVQWVCVWCNGDNVTISTLLY